MNTETHSSIQKKSQKELEKGALWLKKSKAGADFLSGYITDENNNKVNIVVFKNGFKKPGELSPDYRVYVSENTSQVTGGQNKNVAATQNLAQVSPPEKEVDSETDDIPF